MTVNAALGDRPGKKTGQFETMPDVAAPDECPPRPHRRDTSGTINERLDVRLARGRLPADLDGRPSDGQTVMWARLPHVIDGVDTTALAIMGDYVPSGTGQALGVVERYDPDRGDWESLSAMPTPRSAFAAATVGGRVLGAQPQPCLAKGVLHSESMLSKYV